MCHVLIIEDEPMIAIDLETVLAREGATSFDIVSTEAEAVAAARVRKPDLITSDVKLIQGTGPRAVEQIRNEVGDVPVIFITGTPDDCKPCAPPGIIIAKPYAAARVRSAFREMAPL